MTPAAPPIRTPGSTARRKTPIPQTGSYCRRGTALVKRFRPLPTHIDLRADEGAESGSVTYYARRSARDPEWRLQQLQEAKEREARHPGAELDHVRALARASSRRSRERQRARGLTFRELLARSPRVGAGNPRPERLRKGGGGLGLPPEQPCHDFPDQSSRRAAAVIEAFRAHATWRSSYRSPRRELHPSRLPALLWPAALHVEVGSNPP